MKRSFLTLLVFTSVGRAAFADFVYVTSTPSNCVSVAECGANINSDVNINFLPVYSENSVSGDFTSAIAISPGKPTTPGARYFSNSFSNSAPSNWIDGFPPLGVTVSPTLGITGGVYRVYHVFSSAAGNVSTNVVLGVTNTDGCTLSFTNTDKFQSQYGGLANGMNTFQFLGFLTNKANTSTPTVTFFFQDGDVNAGAQRRLLIDSFLFVSDPCTAVAQVGISGSYAVNSTTVTVTGVDASATNVKVYQYTNGIWTTVGQKTSGITAGNNSVTVSGLVKGGQLAATQTVGGQEGCLWGIPTGVVVGAPNPRVRLALSLRETSSTGPIGASGATAGFAASANIFFLGVTNRIGSAPGFPGAVLYPSNSVWQTVTFDPGMQSVGNSSNAAGRVLAGNGYAPNDSVAIQVYAYKTVTANGVTVYSPTGAQSSASTSNDLFLVNWTWDAVAGAEGYRLLRNRNSNGYSEYADVPTNNFSDDSVNGWIAGNTVTPTLTQIGPSVKWNTATGYEPVGTVSGLHSNWYTLESLNFVIDDLTSTGPYDIYLDTIQNGPTVFYTYENSPAGATDVGFRAPNFSGTTSGNLAGSPNSAVVANNAAYEGTKSLRVQWAWNGTVNTRWLRLTTSGVGNPLVDVNFPLSIRYLLVPDGGTYPASPTPPRLFVTRQGTDTVLNWTGGHRLQSSVSVPGTYTNTGVILGPYTNAFSEPTRFFRLVD